jgi:hypothetical protein
MERRKDTSNTPPPPRPGGAWLAGMLIGATIMTMAAQAIMLGVGAAIGGAPRKGG